MPLIMCFFMLMWLMCSCSRALGCKDTGTIILLPFITIPSMMAISSQKGQYCCISSLTPVLVDGQAFIKYAYLIDHLHHTFQDVSAHFNSFNVKVKPVISSSLPSLWLCLENQSAICSCGPGLYRILMLY